MELDTEKNGGFGMMVNFCISFFERHNNIPWRVDDFVIFLMTLDENGQRRLVKPQVKGKTMLPQVEYNVNHV